MARPKYDIDYNKESNKPKGKKKMNLGISIGGIVFLVFGLVAFIVGCVFLYKGVSQKEDRIYTTAVIAGIDRDYGFDSEDVEYIVYVTHEYDGQIVVGRLHSGNSTMYIGKEVEVYFYEDDIHYLYEEGTEFISAIASMILGIAFFTTGIFILKDSSHNSNDRATTVVEYDY